MSLRHSPRTSRAICSLAAAIAGLSLVSAARADQLWDWHYAGTGVNAFGTLTTTDTADANGFLQITAITGTRNGDLITTLQPNHTPIPGNEPFAVDNLVKANGDLTGEGFGYGTQSGTYANVFFADWATPAGDFEFSSVPALHTTSELAVSFELKPVAAVPEPSTMLLAALGGLVLVWRCRVRSSRPVDCSRS